MKHYVYKDELPFNVYSPKGRRVDQLKKHFEADLPNLIFDPLSILLNNKDNKKLFYKLDNHWNFHSGYLTTQKLIEKIKVDIPNSNLTQMPGVDWLDTVIYSGFHHSVIGIPELNEIRQIPFVQNIASVESEKYGFPCVPNFAYPWEYEIRYTNKKTKSGLKILFIRDSFGGQMMPYIKEMFAESVFIFDAWRYQFNKPIIEAVKPDVIVYLGLETHLENMLKDYK
jgi:alginate O-acetyltransferase complex protein AlgJ